MEVIIREYKDSDNNQVVQLFNDFQDYLVAIDTFGIEHRTPQYGNNYLSKTLRENNEQEGVFFVAEINNQIIGFISGKIKRTTLEEQNSNLLKAEGEITELYIKQEYRSQHIGSQLMKKIENYFYKKDCEAVFVSAFAPNIQAQNFYQKQEYEVCDINLIKRIK